MVGDGVLHEHSGVSFGAGGLDQGAQAVAVEAVPEVKHEGIAAHEAPKVREHGGERVVVALLDARDLGVEGLVLAELVLQLRAEGRLDRHGRVPDARPGERIEGVHSERAVGHRQQVRGLGGNHYCLVDHWLQNGCAEPDLAWIARSGV